MMGCMKEIEKMYVHFDSEGNEMDSAVKKARYMGVSLSFIDDERVVLRVGDDEVNLCELPSDDVVLTFDAFMLLMNAMCWCIEDVHPDMKRYVDPNEVENIHPVVRGLLGMDDD